MAKLFNKIRKQLVSEKPSLKRTTNYLKYAFGEIVLVVIGILIALQVNTWNENRKNRVYEKKILYEVRSALVKDIERFNYLIERIQKIDSCAQKVIAYYGSVNVDTDSLISYVQCARMGILFSFNSGPFDVISAGGLDKITNDSLRKELIYLYGSRLPVITSLIKNGHNDFVNKQSHFEDFFKAVKKVNKDGTIGIKYVPISDSLMHNHLFLEYIYGTKELNNNDKRLVMNYILKESNKLLLLLNKVLKIPQDDSNI